MSAAPSIFPTRTERFRMASIVRPGTRQNLAKSARTRLLVLSMIQRNPGLSRAELGRQCGLSSGAMTQVADSLIERSLVVERGCWVAGASGRRVALRLSPDIGSIVGISFNQGVLRAVAADLNGEVWARQRMKVLKGVAASSILEQCTEGVKELLSLRAPGHRRLLAIGMAIPKTQETAAVPARLSMDRSGLSTLKKGLRAAFGVPCFIEETVRAAATYERLSGVLRRLTDFIYIDVSEHVSSAIFMNGRICMGSQRWGGGVGHLVVASKGAACACGRTGCLEAMASCDAILRSVHRAIEDGEGSSMASRRPEDLTIERVLDAAAKEDALASRVLDEAAAHIGTACGNLLKILGPQAIVLGGALFRRSPQTMLERVRRSARQYSSRASSADTVFTSEASDEDSSARGMCRIAATALMPSIFQDEGIRAVAQRNVNN